MKDTQGLNFFGYVKSNPLKYTDPDGLQALGVESCLPQYLMEIAVALAKFKEKLGIAGLDLEKAKNGAMILET